MKIKNKLIPKVIGKNTNSLIELFSLKQLNEIKNKIVVRRAYGGLGDIVNSRPLFKTIKILYPDLHVTYASPIEYHSILEDSIYIDKLIDCKKIDLNEYGYKVDISSDCGKYENSHMPFVDKHRSDIWAEISVGIKLIDHDFHFKLEDNITKECIQILNNNYLYDIEKDKKVCIFPKSASQSKDLPDNVLSELISMLKNAGYYPCILHNKENIENNEVPIITEFTLKQLLHVVTVFDYVISVDTGSFHLCGALDIPTLGIFNWTDAKILGKYHKKFVYVQKHRDDENGLECCPCWSWPVCKYRKQQKKRFPLKCMEMISSIEIYQKFKELTVKY